MNKALLRLSSRCRRILAVYLPITFAAFFFLASPCPAAADAVDVVTLPIDTQWGRVSCSRGDPFADAFCNSFPSTVAMKGDFEFDPDMMSVLSGPGVFDLFFESVSEETSNHGPDIYNFVFSVGNGYPNFGFFDISYYEGSWNVVPGSISGQFQEDIHYINPEGFPTFLTVKWAAPTTEPSSILLFATGLLGSLGAVGRARRL